MSLHPEIECLGPSNNGDLLQVDGDDLGYQGRATSSRSQKGGGCKLGCTPDTQSTMLDWESGLGPR